MFISLYNKKQIDIIDKDGLFYNIYLKKNNTIKTLLENLTVIIEILL